MNNWKKIILFSTAALLFVVWYVGHPQSIKTSIPDFSYKYIVKTIDQGYNQGEPVIIGLHGDGDTVNNFYETLLDDLNLNAKIILIQGPYAYSRGYAWPITGPELKLYGDALADVIQQLSEKYSFTGKPMLTGFSGGGKMAYYQAATHPELFSHIIPVSGALATKLVSENGIDPGMVKISVFHGKKDQVVPFTHGVQAVSAFENAGYDIDFTELSGGHLSVFLEGHTIFKNIIEEFYQ